MRPFATILLWALVTWATGSVYTPAFADSMKRVKAQQDILVLNAAVDSFKKDVGRYPTGDEGLAILLAANGGAKHLEGYRAGGYLDRLPKDPWGAEYRYQFPGKMNEGGADIWTMGADGKDGGEGIKGDYGNWPGSFESLIAQEQEASRYDNTGRAILYGAPFGLFVGAPIYVAGVVRARRSGLNARAALKGFHLGVLIYLVCFFPALLILLLWWAPIIA